VESSAAHTPTKAELKARKAAEMRGAPFLAYRDDKSKEHLLEPLNRDALQIAMRVARETGTLLAGDVCNTNLWSDERASQLAVRAMFDEQVAWAAEAGVDCFVAGSAVYGADDPAKAIAALRARAAAARA